MGLIEDANGNKMSEPSNVDGPSNGANGKSTGDGPGGGQTTDIRTVPTGTLIYNLLLVGGKEQGAYAYIQQLEHAKTQQKLVVDPPELQAMYAEFKNLEQARYTMAQELNVRFKEFDADIAKRRGIEIYEPNMPNEPDYEKEEVGD
jgi:hypothetical protein